MQIIPAQCLLVAAQLPEKGSRYNYWHIPHLRLAQGGRAKGQEDNEDTDGWQGEKDGRRGQDVARGTAVAAADKAEPGVFVPAAGPDTGHPRGPGPGAWSRWRSAGIGRRRGVGRGMQRESGPVAGAKTQSLRGARARHPSISDRSMSLPFVAARSGFEYSASFDF